MGVRVRTVAFVEESHVMADWLEAPKTVLNWSGLAARANHVGHLVGVGELAEADTGITIPGLTLQVEVKAPRDVARCLFLFTIFQLKGGVRLRAYQLEVAPSNKRTHNDVAGAVYGPHEHLGEDVTAIRHEDVNCDNWMGSLQWFFDRTGIEPFDIPDPNCHGL